MDKPPSTDVKTRKPQVRPRVMQALTLIVEQGMTIPEAAEMAGMKYESLRLALKRPHVREAQEGVKRAWLASESFVAWNTVAALQRTAASEDVRLKAARTVLGAVGELEQGGGGRSDHPPVLVQIVTRFGGLPDLVANERGVIEAEPYRPDAR